MKWFIVSKVNAKIIKKDLGDFLVWWPPPTCLPLSSTAQERICSTFSVLWSLQATCTFFVHLHNAYYCQSDNLQHFSKLGISYTDTECDIQGSREIVKMRCTCINPCLFPTHPVAIQCPNANRDSVWHILTFCAYSRKAFLIVAQKNWIVLLGACSKLESMFVFELVI